MHATSREVGIAQIVVLSAGIAVDRNAPAIILEIEPVTKRYSLRR